MRYLLSLLLLFPSLVLCAQKAVPVEIVLHNGEGEAKGRLTGRQQIDYEVEASGRTLTVRLSVEPRSTLGIRLYNPQGALIPLRQVDTTIWTATLSQDGVYGITVARINSSARASAYKLKITIR